MMRSTPSERLFTNGLARRNRSSKGIFASADSEAAADVGSGFGGLITGGFIAARPLFRIRVLNLSHCSREVSPRLIENIKRFDLIIAGHGESSLSLDDFDVRGYTCLKTALRLGHLFVGQLQSGIRHINRGSRGLEFVECRLDFPDDARFERFPIFIHLLLNQFLPLDFGMNSAADEKGYAE